MLETMAAAIAHETAGMLANDPKMLVMGLGVGTDPGRIFGTLPPMGVREHQMLETPCSEAAMTGVAAGMCMMGHKVIMVHQRMEFALLAWEQIVNNVAKMEFLSNDHYKCPLLIRLIVGRGWGQGPTHSQDFTGMLAQVPGLNVFVPADASDARGVMRWWNETAEPTIMVEHRWCHGLRSGGVDGHDYPVSEGDDMLRPRAFYFDGNNASELIICASGYIFHEACEAALALNTAHGRQIVVENVRHMNPKRFEWGHIDDDRPTPTFVARIGEIYPDLSALEIYVRMCGALGETPKNQVMQQLARDQPDKPAHFNTAF